MAGALPHVRPFLGRFLRVCRVGWEHLCQVPRCRSEYVVGETEVMSMSRPRRLKLDAMESFRVDAKAEGERIVIGQSPMVGSPSGWIGRTHPGHT